MLSFDFGETLDEFRVVIRSYVRKELLPGYRERGAKDEYPWEAHRALARMGLLGIGLPTDYGGTGESDYLALGIACEEIGYGDVSLASAPTQTGVMGGMIALGAREEVREQYLPGLIRGEHLISLALTEPDSGSDAVALRTTATKVPGGWVLNGEKTSVSHIRDSIASIVFARQPKSTGSKGVSAFVLDHDQSGVSIGRFRDMGLLPIGRGTLSLNEAFVPEANLLGTEGRGFSLVMNNFDFSRPAIALRCLGAAQASLDEAAAHLRERHTFGKPLAARQGLSLPLAEHYTAVEACRWLCYRTLWLRQQGRNHTAEAAMCKWWGPKVARDAIESALLIHGHSGWSDELPFQQRFRDVMAFFIADGTEQIQKLIIARERIGQEVMDRN